MADAMPKEGKKGPTMQELLAAYQQKNLAEAAAKKVEAVERLQKAKEKESAPAFRRGHVPPALVAETKALPIYAKRDKILEMVIDNQVVIIQGETGSGKSTQLVQYFAEAGFAERGKIVCTQPRRVAAKSMAKRVAKECGVEVGKMVGYVVRFDQNVSSSTIIKFVTDGTLVKEFSSDPRLENYSVVIVDEAHERSVSSDVCLGLLKRILPNRPDLKVIISSATMNTGKFSRFFNDAPVLKVSGKLFPVKEVYEVRDYEQNEKLLERCVSIIRSIVRYNPKGDILVFLCGGDEINKTWELLENDSLKEGYSGEIEIMLCHGSMFLEDQERIFAKCERRKVILSTNVAETSLTVDGIVFVIDSGYYKHKEFNAKTGIDTLKPHRITKEMAVQRAGRAGRTQEGKVYRIYTEDTFRSLKESRTPDIQRSNIESTVLDLVSFGVTDLYNFPFIDRPENDNLFEAVIHLQDLGALDNNVELTSLGRQMARFPIDPPLAKTLLTSAKVGCSKEVATIVSLLSTQLHSLFKRGRNGGTKSQIDRVKEKYTDPNGDHLLFLNLFQDLECQKFDEYVCSDNFINRKILLEANDIRTQLCEIMTSYDIPVSSIPASNTDKSAIREAFAAGFIRRLAVLPLGKKYEYVTFNGASRSGAFIHPSSVLFHSTRSDPHQWLLYHELRQTTKPFLNSCIAIKPEWVRKYAPSFWERMAGIHPEFRADFGSDLDLMEDVLDYLH